MSDLPSDLIVDSVTGIDVRLAVAGPGVRSYAFLVDWFIRLILALCWYSFAAFIYNGRPSLAVPLGTHDGRWFGLVLAPTLGIYFLYHWVLEVVMRGRTPGKRMAGVQLVARDGSAPGAGALLTRNAFRLIDCLPAFYAVGLVAVTLTRQNLRVGDMAAGTLLVYERGEAVLPEPEAAGSTLDAAGAEIIAELLARWETLEPDAREELARRVLARYEPAPNAAPDAAPAAGYFDQGLRSRLEALVGR